jgi:uncharacterized DUF497 family protein
VEIIFDQAKRDRTFAERGLAFEDAAFVFAGPHFTIADDRRDYGEPRYLTFGQLGGRVVTFVWTPRGEACRVISMRYADEQERARYRQRLQQG